MAKPRILIGFIESLYELELRHRADFT